MTYAEIAKRLKIAEKTVYNWKENRKELLEIVIKGLECNEKNVNVTNNHDELCNLLKKLNEKEREMYIHEIKARILRKEIDK